MKLDWSLKQTCSHPDHCLHRVPELFTGILCQWWEQLHAVWASGWSAQASDKATSWNMQLKKCHRHQKDGVRELHSVPTEVGSTTEESTRSKAAWLPSLPGWRQELKGKERMEVSPWPGVQVKFFLVHSTPLGTAVQQVQGSGCGVHSLGDNNHLH